jgi:hypothetical protein
MVNLSSVFPWWSKIILKIILSRLPFSYQFYRFVGIFKHGEMQDSQYAFKVFNSLILKSYSPDFLVGKTILELGVGDSLSTALIAASFKANSILVDNGYYASENIETYKHLYHYLVKLGLTPPDIRCAESIEEYLNICGSCYMTSGLLDLKKLDAGSVDLIFSNAVLEHICLSEFSFTIKELHRVQKSDGASHHVIDLKDHLGGGLNNLRFSRKVWESSLFSNSGFYTNRLRASQIINIFIKEGFIIKDSDVKSYPCLPIPLYSMNGEFRDLDVSDLLINQIFIFATRF